MAIEVDAGHRSRYMRRLIHEAEASDAQRAPSTVPRVLVQFWGQLDDDARRRS